MSFNITRNASPQNTARSATLSEYSCSRVGYASGAGNEPTLSTFPEGIDRWILWQVRGSDAPRVFIRSGSCSAMREPLSIDVQSPLYTHLGLPRCLRR